MYAITQTLKMMKQRSPPATRPVIAPAQVKRGSCPESRQSVAATSAPDSPPMTATVYLVVGLVANLPFLVALREDLIRKEQSVLLFDGTR